MTREEWHKWKKSLDLNYKIPSKEEDDRMDYDAHWSEGERQAAEKRRVEEEAQRQRDFTAFYNHT